MTLYQTYEEGANSESRLAFTEKGSFYEDFIMVLLRSPPIKSWNNSNYAGEYQALLGIAKHYHELLRCTSTFTTMLL